MQRAVWLGFLLALSPGPPARADDETPSHISATELLGQIESGTAPVVLDVRSRSEFEQGHVPGAIHLPFWAVMARADQVPTAPDEPVIVTCEHGPRAGLAKAGLWLAGFERITYLEGHMAGWKKAGLPLETGPESPGTVPPETE